MKKYVFFVVLFLYFCNFGMNKENFKSVDMYNQSYITAVNPNKNFIQKNQCIKETVVFFISVIVSFIALMIKEFVDNVYLHKENQTSHFGMKHRIQNPRCKLYKIIPKINVVVWLL